MPLGFLACRHHFFARTIAIASGGPPGGAAPQSAKAFYVFSRNNLEEGVIKLIFDGLIFLFDS